FINNDSSETNRKRYKNNHGSLNVALSRQDTAVRLNAVQANYPPARLSRLKGYTVFSCREPGL
ncbi:MAG: hypothetical protein ACI9TP_001068, partial [Candidatus Azotimanducaceae bacterium]